MKQKYREKDGMTGRLTGTQQYCKNLLLLKIRAYRTVFSNSGVNWMRTIKTVESRSGKKDGILDICGGLDG